MAQVQVRAHAGSAPDEVWQLVGDFVVLTEALIAGMDDARVEFTGEGLGMERKVTVGLDTVVERLEMLDPEHWRTGYSMPVSGPFPVSGYSAVIELAEAADGGCDVTWTGTFEPDGVSEAEAADVVRRVYGGAVRMLQERFGA
jgi:hypothetical protein